MIKVLLEMTALQAKMVRPVREVHLGLMVTLDPPAWWVPLDLVVFRVKKENAGLLVNGVKLVLQVHLEKALAMMQLHWQL